MRQQLFRICVRSLLIFISSTCTFNQDKSRIADWLHHTTIQGTRDECLIVIIVYIHSWQRPTFCRNMREQTVQKRSDEKTKYRKTSLSNISWFCLKERTFIVYRLQLGNVAEINDECNLWWIYECLMNGDFDKWWIKLSILTNLELLK